MKEKSCTAKIFNELCVLWDVVLWDVVLWDVVLLGRSYSVSLLK